MYSVPASILNDIARTQPLRTKWARRLFALDDAGISAARAMQADEMEAQGVPDRVILAYQTMALLLAENEAISNYIVATDRMDLRSALPEIVSVREAILVADGDYRLADDEKERLAAMLTPLDPWAQYQADEADDELASAPSELTDNPLTRLASKLDASPTARKLLAEALMATKGDPKKT